MKNTKLLYYKEMQNTSEKLAVEPVDNLFNLSGFLLCIKKSSCKRCQRMVLWF